jgi:hypothetical protein
MTVDAPEIVMHHLKDRGFQHPLPSEITPRAYTRPDATGCAR